MIIFVLMHYFMFVLQMWKHTWNHETARSSHKPKSCAICFLYFWHLFIIEKYFKPPYHCHWTEQTLYLESNEKWLPFCGITVLLSTADVIISAKGIFVLESSLYLDKSFTLFSAVEWTDSSGTNCVTGGQKHCFGPLTLYTSTRYNLFTKP